VPVAALATGWCSQVYVAAGCTAVTPGAQVACVLPGPVAAGCAAGCLTVLWRAAGGGPEPV